MKRKASGERRATRADNHERAFVGLLGLIGLLFIGTSAAAQGDYEVSPTLKASDILPHEMLSGPHHRIVETVSSDGYLNTYTIRSPFGEITTTGTASVPIYLSEINAIAAMEDVKKTDAYTDAAKNAVTGAYEGAKNLVTRPVEAIGGAVSGVGRLFRRAADSAQYRDKSDTEDASYKAAIGYSRAKRDVAARFGVDVYSRNPLLQERLDDLAWTEFAGDITVRAPLAFVPGGVGMAVTTSQTVTALNDVVATTPPQDLRIHNREKLAAMGVNEDIADLFIANPIYTPREQTFIVGALESMAQATNREAFIKFAVSTDTADLAFFRQRMAMLFSAYNEYVEPITEFVELGRFVAGRTAKGAVVMLVPVDYLVWSKTTADALASLDSDIAALSGLSSKQLWVDGLSPRAKEELISRGWDPRENAEEVLLGQSLE